MDSLKSFDCYLLVILALLTFQAGAFDILKSLKYFETLHVSSIHHHIEKRGTKGKADHIKELKFKGLGRNFRLYLKPTVGLLSPDFKAYAVDGYGNMSSVYIDRETFYSGHVFGEKHSSVSAHIDDTSVLTAAISTSNDAYYIEPMWRHNSTAANDTMVMYKESDIVNENKTANRFCGYVNKASDAKYNFSSSGNIANNENFKKFVNNAERQNKRSKRSRPKLLQLKWTMKNRLSRCSLLLVADYRFFRHMGQSSATNSINYMANVIQVVNTIFQDTVWSYDLMGKSFLIKKVLVHTEPQKNLEDYYAGLHYNMETTAPWIVEQLLRQFSVENHRDYCLAHLFTHQKFHDGILGLAYIASARLPGGGICTVAEYDNEKLMWYNTGLSSSLNFAENTVLKRQANLITAHELGHNWGSEHDPETEECTPGEPDGAFLMFTYAVSGYYKNNHKFSPCSRRSVGAVLLSKHEMCFIEENVSLCGNYQVEEGEECDAGTIYSGNEDPCCTSECRLQPSAKCSDKNSPCCKNCQIVPAGQLCRSAFKMDAVCEGDATCDGIHASCPSSPDAENGTTCLDDGQCWGGVCLPFCEIPLVGKKSCLCEGEDACKRCCRDINSAKCVKYANDQQVFGISLEPGQPCYRGTCDAEGICLSAGGDLIQRFWDVIESIDIDYIIHKNCFPEVFVHNNIVSLILVVSLIVWVPTSCYINYRDNEQKRILCKTARWKMPNNRDICLDDDNTSIRNFGLRTVNSLRSRKLSTFCKVTEIFPKRNIPVDERSAISSGAAGSSSSSRVTIDGNDSIVDNETVDSLSYRESLTISQTSEADAKRSCSSDVANT